MDEISRTEEPAHGSLCLVIHNHFKVKIRSGFDPSLLRQLILALRGAA